MNSLGWYLLAAALLLALVYALRARARRLEEILDSCPRCLKRIIYPRVAPAPSMPSRRSTA
jgi:hypothetical protein